MKKALEIGLIISAYDKASRVINEVTGNAMKKMSALQRQSDKLGKSMQSFGKEQIAGGAAIALAMVAPIKAAADFEAGMTDVRKVVDGLDDAKAFAKMNDQVRRLALEIPLTHKELTDLVAAGGRMDVPRNQLVNYTRDVAKMSVAFEMAAGEVGETMGKIAKAFDKPINKVGELADTINYLDDKSISKGADIMEVVLRTAAVAKQAGLADKNLAALSSTFLTLGSRPEVAATSINALIRELSIATVQPKRFQEGIKALNLDAAKLQKSMSIDPQNTILKVLEKLSALPKDQQIQVATQVFGKEYGDDISKLSTGMKEYTRQIKLANSAAAAGSMDREYQKRLKTFNAQKQIFLNMGTDLLIEFGTGLLPVLIDVMKAVKPYLSAATNWIKNNKELSVTIGKAILFIAGFKIALGGASLVVGSALRTYSALSRGLGYASKAFKALQFASFFLRYHFVTSLIPAVGKMVGAFSTFGAALLANPITWYIAGAVALGAAAYLIYKNWDKIAAFFSRTFAKLKQPFFDLLGFVFNFGGKFETAGQSIPKMIAKGMLSAATLPVRAMLAMVKKIRNYLPFSPAKEGPFMDLHKVKIVETIASGIKPGPLVKAMKNTTGAAMNAANGSGGLNPRSGGGGGMSITVAPVFNISGSTGSGIKNDLTAATYEIKRIVKQVIEENKRNGARVSFAG